MCDFYSFSFFRIFTFFYFQEELRLTAVEKNPSESSLPTSPGLLTHMVKVIVKIIDEHEIHKGILSSRKLRSQNSYVLDAGHRSNVFVWNGSSSLPGQKREALRFAQLMVSKENYGNHEVIVLPEGRETSKFKSFFSWHRMNSTTDLSVLIE